MCDESGAVYQQNNNVEAVSSSLHEFLKVDIQDRAVPLSSKEERSSQKVEGDSGGGGGRVGEYGDDGGLLAWLICPLVTHITDDSLGWHQKIMTSNGSDTNKRN